MKSQPVVKFAEDVVAPKVREMDENEMMDPEVIQGLFDTGVRQSVRSHVQRIFNSFCLSLAYGYRDL